MSKQASTSKRPLDRAASPPPAAKLTKLASMFAPASSKEPSLFTWLPPLAGCMHGVYDSSNFKGSTKVAAFDLDGTVIAPRSGNKFPKDKDDWKYWNGTVPKVIRDLHADGYAILFISNQAGNSASQDKFAAKMPLLGADLKVPFHVYAAKSYNQYRKPAHGSWEHFRANCNEGIEIDASKSFYIGDAAGRAGDHSDTDRKMAMNVDIAFHTPEAFFLKDARDEKFTLSGWDPSSYDHSVSLFTPTSTPIILRTPKFSEAKPEVVLFVGSPGSGKSHFYKTHFLPAGYTHINQDTLGTRAKCLKAVESSLSSGKSCVVDNTNPTLLTRKEYLDLIQSSFPDTVVRAFYFAAIPALAKHMATYRLLYEPEAGRIALPGIAFATYSSRLEIPTVAEGFSEVKTIQFKFEGTTEGLKEWQKWLDGMPVPKLKGKK